MHVKEYYDNDLISIKYNKIISYIDATEVIKFYADAVETLEKYILRDVARDLMSFAM